ncbi:hypothetical protein AYI68_g3057 [Smittium mucronatum]|uniref:SMP-LTD domain-containing protein n=1 Tax=Smittium mucronatum TaxID=133383 RepID=A0A1R0H0X9_9FUNG|nr:hypothetical protein AYI68_g3057 [Smittium mucronatum]
MDSTYPIRFSGFVEYKGCISVAVKSKLSIISDSKIPTVFTIQLNSLASKFLVQINPFPSNRIWFGLYPNLQIKMSLSSSIVNKKINSESLLNFFKAKLLESFGNSIVLPNMIDYVLYKYSKSDEEIYDRFDSLFEKNSDPTPNTLSTPQSQNNSSIANNISGAQNKSFYIHYSSRSERRNPRKKLQQNGRKLRKNKLGSRYNPSDIKYNYFNKNPDLIAELSIPKKLKPVKDSKSTLFGPFFPKDTLKEFLNNEKKPQKIGNERKSFEILIPEKSSSPFYNSIKRVAHFKSKSIPDLGNKISINPHSSSIAAPISETKTHAIPITESHVSKDRNQIDLKILSNLNNENEISEFETVYNLDSGFASLVPKPKFKSKLETSTSKNLEPFFDPTDNSIFKRTANIFSGISKNLFGGDHNKNLPTDKSIEKQKSLAAESHIEDELASTSEKNSKSINRDSVLLKPEFSSIGASTIFGSSNLDSSTQNELILEKLQTDIPSSFYKNQNESSTLQNSKTLNLVNSASKLKQPHEDSNFQDTLIGISYVKPNLFDNLLKEKSNQISPTFSSYGMESSIDVLDQNNSSENYVIESKGNGSPKNQRSLGSNSELFELSVQTASNQKHGIATTDSEHPKALTTGTISTRNSMENNIDCHKNMESTISSHTDEKKDFDKTKSIGSNDLDNREPKIPPKTFQPLECFDTLPPRFETFNIDSLEDSFHIPHNNTPSKPSSIFNEKLSSYNVNRASVDSLNFSKGSSIYSYDPPYDERNSRTSGLARKSRISTGLGLRVDHESGANKKAYLSHKESLKPLPEILE